MEYYQNKLCIEVGWLTDTAKIVSLSNYKYMVREKTINVIRRACKGTPALIEYDSIPERFKVAISQFIGGDPYNKVKVSKFEDHLKPDVAAIEFFSNFKLSDGRNLPEDTQREYKAAAEVLNAIRTITGSQSARRKALGGRSGKLWQRIPEIVHSINTENYPHNLPKNERRLKQKFSNYIKEGYSSLISKKFGNNNSRKVNVKIESLLLSLYSDPHNKPYSNEVYEKYMQFLAGVFEVVDVNTGEIFDRSDFMDEEGKPLTISESTVWNYINNPKNALLVNKSRAGALEFNTKHRPHHHRHAPQWSLSKVSLDDRDLPRKMHNGKRVKAYYAYDVTSGCVIGASYNKNKDKSLFIDCLRDMFRFIKKNSFGMPLEVEVEHHLVNHYRNDLMKAGVIFPFVRWANPGNAQEKYAETMNRTKKYGYEKRYQDGIGRFYAKLEANRTHQDKVFDDENNNYKEKTYDYEQLVADDMHMIHLLNNDLHPNQKLYKGMTRLEVLKHKVNPDLANINDSLLYKYIGNKTATAIRRSQYVKVRYENFQLPSPEILSRLKPNNYNVDAYWLTDGNNTIESVHIWQDDEYICECKKIVEYNRSTAEQTQVDKDAYQNQSKYVSEFDSMIKNARKELPKIEIINTDDEIETTKVEIIPEVELDFDDDFNDYEPLDNDPLNSL